ncbi:replicative DNA helicase [Oenococcus sicerae]|uniref:Replicative DNA helicase n=1 Tax=Oenococcus sicerae TaxID=2203724 RepID=A0ABX5QN80_9LACO|nr:replicative DNA helicase [Oenococcus sicerae]QAS70240.1 replicative DNA helicase [Oenococcus sicerae]
MTENPEQLLAASVLMSSDPEDIYLQIQSGLKHGDLVDDQAIKAFKIIKHNFDLSLGIDGVSILQTTKDVDLINHLTDLPVNPKRVSDYLKSVKKQAFARRLEQGINVAKSALENGADSKSVMQNLNQIMATYNESESSIKSLHTALDSTLSQIQDRFNNPGKQIGLSTGFKTIDKMILGLQPGELTIIAARPSVGKTALALNMLRGASKSTDLPILLFSLEMSDDSLNLRLLASVSNVDLWKIKTGHMTKDELKNVLVARDILAKRNIYLDDESLQSIDDIQAKVFSFQRKHGQIGLVMVDYLGLIDTKENKNSNRVNEVSKISRGLKVMAGDLKAPVVALSQLSRSVESRSDKRPMLSDLRDSGSIEQDADMVAFLYRDDYYKNQPNEQDPKEVTTEFIIAKNRNGERGTVYLIFSKEKQRFLERTA